MLLSVVIVVLKFVIAAVFAEIALLISVVLSVTRPETVSIEAAVASTAPDKLLSCACCPLMVAAFASFASITGCNHAPPETFAELKSTFPVAVKFPAVTDNAFKEFTLLYWFCTGCALTFTSPLPGL